MRYNIWIWKILFSCGRLSFARLSRCLSTTASNTLHNIKLTADGTAIYLFFIIVAKWLHHQATFYLWKSLIPIAIPATSIVTDARAVHLFMVT